MADTGPFNEKLTNAIAGLVAIVWAASFLADIVIENYNPSPYVHLIMATIVGSITGRAFIRSNGK